MIQIFKKASGLVRRLLPVAMVVSLAALPVSSASGAPETWFEPAASLLGTEAGARLGEALSCSNPVGGAQGESFIAAAAPDEDSGRGAVYIYRFSTSTSNPVQRLISGAPGAGKRFGASVAFFKDVNGDGIDELAIGEPDPSGASGKVWLYFSQAGATPYLYCNVHVGPQQWGQTMTSLRSFRSAEAVGTLVIGTPATNRARSLTISFSGSNGPNVCDVAMQGFFDSTGPAQSAFGSGVAEVPYTGVLVGAPSFNSFAGRVYLNGQYGQQTLIESGSAGDLLGASVAGRGSSIFAAYAAATMGLVKVKKVTGNFFTPLIDQCSAPVSVPQLSSQGIAHLGSTFSSFLGSGGDPDVAIAVQRTESETGGSVALFAATNAGMCTEPKFFNNCASDPVQEQGGAIYGGAGCVTNLTGSAKPMFLVGSPGAGGSKGRFDVVIEGTQLASAKGCAAGGGGGGGNGNGGGNGGDGSSGGGNGGGGSSGGDNGGGNGGNGDLGNQEPTPTPIPESSPSAQPTLFQPGEGGLPAAAITKQQGSGLIVITLPEVRLKSTAALEKLIAKKWRFSPNKARKIVAGGYKIFYEIRVTTQTKRKKVATLSDLLVSAAFANSGTKQRLISTRNRITTLRLSQGTLLTTAWRAGVKFPKERRTLLTKFSPKSTFQN